LKKIILALLCLLIAAAAQATTYYVSPTGSNANSGLTVLTAWKTISYASTQSASGSTVYVAPGTYGTAEGERFPLTINGKYISSSLHQAIINTNANLAGGKISLETGSILDSFTIGGSSAATAFFLIQIDAGTSAHDVIIRNNSINAAGHQVAIHREISSENITIEGNVIFSSLYDAIWLQNNGNATIKQNEIRNNSGGPAVIIDGATSGTIVIDRNTVVNNGHMGIQTSNPSGATILINNNIVANNTQDWLNLAVPVSSRKYNDVYNNGGGVALDPTDLALDPKSNNAGANDYSLKVNSPCINAGNPDNDNDLTTFYDDADDRDPDNTRLDIGAYYYNVGSGPFFVSAAEGDDNFGDGTELHPFLTLTRVGTFAALDSTVYVKSGTYGSESWPLNLSGLNVNSSPEGQATIALPNDTAGYIVTMSNRAGKLQGFSLTGRATGLPSSAGILVSDKPAIIRNNTIYAQSFDNGIKLAAGSSGSIINGNIIYGNDKAGANGIKIDQTVISNEIYKNVIRNFDNGLYLKGVVDAVPATTFHHNTLVKNNTGVYVEHAGATLNSNIIACGVGGHATAGTIGIKAVNDALTGVVSTYNTLYANETVYDDSGSKVSNKIGDATTDPLFIDPTANDYHLQAASPAINTGDPSAQYTDLDGTRGDRGAYYRDVVPPAVTISAPNGGETLIGGKNSDITWTATDLGDGFSSTPITFRYSTNEGASWTQIETGQYNLSPYTWLVPAVSYTTCRVSVEAVDLLGNIGTDMSNSNFTISGGLSPSEGSYVNTTTPTFTWTAIDGATSYTVLVDGVERGAGIANTTFPLNVLYALTEGAHTWTLQAIGGRFGVVISETLVHFTVDLTNPAVILNSFTSSAVAGVEITISGTVSDNYLIDKAEISFDNKATWSEMTLSGTNIEYKKSFATPGTYTINARVTDRAGNATIAAPLSLTVVAGGTGGLVTELSYSTGAANGLAILNMKTANLESGILTIMLFDSNPPNTELSRNTISVDSTTSLASINLAAGGVSLSRKTVICKVFNNGKLILSKNILVP